MKILAISVVRDMARQTATRMDCDCTVILHDYLQKIGLVKNVKKDSNTMKTVAI
jgi:hypothetical protein